jgi:hypothetical protein
LLVGFVDPFFSKLSQVVHTCRGEPREAQQEPQTVQPHREVGNKLRF